MQGDSEDLAVFTMAIYNDYWLDQGCGTVARGLIVALSRSSVARLGATCRSDTELLYLGLLRQCPAFAVAAVEEAVRCGGCSCEPIHHYPVACRISLIYALG